MTEFLDKFSNALGRLTILGALIILIIAFGELFRMYRQGGGGISSKYPDTLVVFKIDTIYMRDTVRVPSERVRLVRVHVMDTVYVEVPSGSDSLALEIESRTYTDDSTFRAVVSGYRPKLDSIDVFAPKAYITRVKTLTITRPASRWSLGVTVGPAVIITRSGRTEVGAGVVAGVQYRF